MPTRLASGLVFLSMLFPVSSAVLALHWVTCLWCEGEDAESILDHAIAAQHGDALASDVKDIDVSFVLTVNDAKRGRIDLDVERKWKAPDRLWTHTTETALSGSESQEGFDGKVGWFKNKKTCVRYEGPDHKADREKLEGDLRQQRLILRFFFLANLKSALSDMKRKDDWKQTTEDGTVLDQYVIEGALHLDPDDGGDAHIELYVEKESFRLLSARLTRTTGPDSTPTALTFAFWGHSPAKQGVIVPGIVKIFVDDSKEWSQKLALEGEDGEHGEVLNKIRFNTGVEDEQFAPPCP